MSEARDALARQLHAFDHAPFSWDETPETHHDYLVMADQSLAALTAAGYVVAPREATPGMQNAGAFYLITDAGAATPEHCTLARHIWRQFVKRVDHENGVAAALADRQTVRPSTGKAEPPPGWSES